ncbi:LysR substrate-binding domain-containing protein [Stenotrophomonas sp. C3(2023)]|uniref:LysR substrate-binding domain-containing protein n=1 Tax=Stenotrophomonas sp. C3(2023) TaxID=3080277 RepID=UPI00293C51C2|nr:LysR substrate-binding domain-containing protein [Stenotrophomonas sp. C3(2023)]MDV3467371.1 LysR substrate-binding domain-containing protein [Stenotrophomonas sp. C3(2023)]
MSIELRHLRYFLAVADTLHFGQAAERLGMSQPPLSQQIRQLEQLIGAQLFVRSHRRVQLTEAGTLLQQQARSLLLQVDATVEQVQRVQRGERGELHIGLTRATPLSAQIPRAIFDYRQRYPQVRLQLREMNTLQQIDALLEGELDVGIIRRRTLPPELVARSLFTDPLAVVLHRQHPALRGRDPASTVLALEQLAHEPFVAFHRSAGAGIHDHTIALCAAAGFTPRIVQEAGEASTLISLAAAGLGAAILPASCDHIHVEGACFVALADSGAHSEVQLVWRRESVTPLIRNFTALLLARLPAG